MNPAQILSRKNFWKSTSFIIAIISLAFLFSCKEKKNEKKAAAAPAGASCLTLTSAQLSDWIPRYTNPKNIPDELITDIKFYSSYDYSSRGYKVTAVAYNHNEFPLGDPIELAPGTSCPVRLPSLFSGTSNDISLKDLNILKGNGNFVTDFREVVLLPYPYRMEQKEYLAYNINVLIGSQTRATAPSLPCPPCPNCRPSCPDGCTPPCDKADSIKGKIPPYDTLIDSLN